MQRKVTAVMEAPSAAQYILLRLSYHQRLPYQFPHDLTQVKMYLLRFYHIIC